MFKGSKAQDERHEKAQNEDLYNKELNKIKAPDQALDVAQDKKLNWRFQNEKNNFTHLIINYHNKSMWL